MNGDKPRCSIVIPTHQRRERVIRTLRTIQAQTYSAIEIVVSIDGSTDGTYEAIDALHDDRIIIVQSETARGVANARNRGVAASTGDYVGFCDDDDFWTPGKVAGQIEKMQETGNLWSFSPVINIGDDFDFRNKVVPVLDDGFFERLLYSNVVPGGCSSVICDRVAFEKAGRFDSQFSMFADWDMWIRLAEQSPPSVWEEPGTLYVFHDNQMSLDMSKIRPEVAALRQKHRLQRSKYSARSLEPVDRWIAQQLWKAGQRRQSIWYRLSCDSDLDVRAILRSVFRIATRRYRKKPQPIDLAAEHIVGLVRNIAFAGQVPTGSRGKASQLKRST